MKHKLFASLSTVLLLAILFTPGKALSQKLLASKYSNVYHLSSCRWAERIAPGNLIMFSTPAEATAAGYRPCKVCRPPMAIVRLPKKNGSRIDGKSSNPPSESGRCQAVTKKGTQCKRRAQSGSIYCWQHNR